MPTVLRRGRLTGRAPGGWGRRRAHRPAGRRRPIPTPGVSAGSGGPSKVGRSPRGTETSRTTPGHRCPRRGTGRRGPRDPRTGRPACGRRQGPGRHRGARRAAAPGSRLAPVGRPHHGEPVLAVGGDERGDRLGVDPGEAGGPDERGLRVGHQAHRGLDAVDDLAHGAALRRCRVREGDLGVRERGGHGSVGVERAHDDGRGAAGPGHVREAPDGGRAGGVGESGCRACGQDDGGNGHGVLLVLRGSVAAGTFRGRTGYCRVGRDVVGRQPASLTMSCPPTTRRA